MFDSSTLKAMKLSELQEIAKLSGTIKVAGAKKEALIQQILELQEKTNSQENATETPVEKIANPKEIGLNLQLNLTTL